MKGMKALKKVKCSKCGLQWGVSAHRKSKKPYICPHCQFKVNVRKLVLFLVGFFITCLLVPKASQMAYQQRGYIAVGGEIFIPFVYLATVGLIHMVWRWDNGES